MTVRTKATIRKDIKEDSGAKYRYRCPHCNSARLRKRHLTNWLLQYKECQEMTPWERRSVDVRDVAEYFCRSCNEPIEADERIDTASSKRCSSFFYDSEKEMEQIQYDNGGYKNEAVLRELYCEQKCTQSEIAQRFNCSPKTIQRWMEKYGIETDRYRY